MLSFTFLGTSSGVPTRQRNVSGVALELGGGQGWLLIDAGEGTQHRLLQTRLSLHTLAAICITHAHGDHCYGLPGLLESAGLAGRTRALPLIAPAAVRDWLQATRSLTDAPLPFEIAFVDVAAQPLVWQAPGLRIERHVLRHRVPSHAYAVQLETRRNRLAADALHALGLPPGPQWKALQGGEDVVFNGQTLRSRDFVTPETRRVRAVFGGDNCAPELLREACTGAQLLVHEATYTQAALDQVGPGPMHSSARMVAAFAQSVALPNLVLTHFSARYRDAAALAPLEAEARAHYDGQLWLANDFDRFELDAAGMLSRRAVEPP